LAEGKVFESALPDEGDVQQLRGRGRRLGSARGERTERKKDRKTKGQIDIKTEKKKGQKNRKTERQKIQKDRFT
jgi:hypothetical protein